MRLRDIIRNHWRKRPNNKDVRKLYKHNRLRDRRMWIEYRNSVKHDRTLNESARYC